MLSSPRFRKDSWGREDRVAGALFTFVASVRTGVCQHHPARPPSKATHYPMRGFFTFWAGSLRTQRNFSLTAVASGRRRPRWRQDRRRKRTGCGYGIRFNGMIPNYRKRRMILVAGSGRALPRSEVPGWHVALAESATSALMVCSRRMSMKLSGKGSKGSSF